MSIAIATVIAALAVWGTVGTVLVTRRDGYGRVPVRH